MIKLIAGLGNPGQEYIKTRHNAGFLFLEYLLSRYSGSWAIESKFHGQVATSFIGDNKVMLLKPQTFMNRSGHSVGAMAKYYKFKIDEVLVVHDELDFSAGVVKLKKGGGHAGHNGLRDIIANLGDKSFYRIRLGIGRPRPGEEVSNYVLSSPSREEQKQMLLAFDMLDSQIDKIVAGNIEAAMLALN